MRTMKKRLTMVIVVTLALGAGIASATVRDRSISGGSIASTEQSMTDGRTPALPARPTCRVCETRCC
jgi:hypothetical protein